MSPQLKGVLGALGLMTLTAVGVFAPVRAPVAAAPALVAEVASASDPTPPIASSDAPTTDASPPPPADVTPTGILPDGRIVLNVATEDDLEKLPGIGPSRAKAIVLLRTKLGKFKAVSELLRVKGIGRKSLAKLAPKVVVDAPKPPTA